MIQEIFKYSLSNLWARKLRVSLTVISILIGIAAIFALISFGQGINSYMKEYGEEMGTDKIFLMTGGGFTQIPGTSNLLFTEEDLTFVSKINGVGEITGMYISTGEMGYKDFVKKYPMIFGLSTDSSEEKLVNDMFAGIEIIDGRSLKEGDILKANLGYSYSIPNKMFKKAVSVGDIITINSVEVRVIGIYEEIGNPSDDAQIYMSKEGFQEIFDKGGYEYIYISATKDQSPTSVAERIKEELRKQRGQKKGEEDFSVQSYEDLMKTFTQIIVIINAVLVIIALISVIVAAVNIVNTMYTSVLERTQEIGVMKSIGARNKFVALIFTIEAGILGLIGGFIGICFGYLISSFGGYVAAQNGLALLKPIFPLWLIMGCLAFAFLIGAFAGIFPAMQAAKLRPVVALRYE